MGLILIKSCDISVIIQGEFDKFLTPASILSVKKEFPDAEIILSTWRDRELPYALADKVIVSDDPGGLPGIIDKKTGKVTYNNVNRQIVSTISGLRSASRPFAVKMRSDFCLVKPRFLEYFSKFRYRNRNRVDIFNSRIVCNASGCVDPRISFASHPGDFFFFGEVDDLVKLFDIPLYQPMPLSAFNTRMSRIRLRKEEMINIECSLFPEIHIWSFVMKKYGQSISNSFEWNEELVASTLESFVDNLIPLSDNQIGLDSSKHVAFEKNNIWRSLRHVDWLTLQGLEFKSGQDDHHPRDSEYSLTFLESRVIKAKKTFLKRSKRSNIDLATIVYYLIPFWFLRKFGRKRKEFNYGYAALKNLTRMEARKSE